MGFVTRRSALEKLGTRIEEGRPVTSVPIPEPASKVRAVRDPYPIHRGTCGDCGEEFAGEDHRCPSTIERGDCE